MVRDSDGRYRLSQTNPQPIGYVHSLESFGAVDGPGIRFVVFLQGCPLSCLYCHNPDTREPKTGKTYTVDALMAEIGKYRSFIRSGGVTFSGGEPLMQPEFLEAMLHACRRDGIHTVIDTSGCFPLAHSQACIDAADLILLDLKSIDTDTAKALTGMGNENMLAILEYFEKTQKPVHIRQVLLDGYTLNMEHAQRMGSYLKRFTCVEKIELLPFHKMGEHKWQEMGLKYMLWDVEEPTPERVKEFREIMEA